MTIQEKRDAIVLAFSGNLTEHDARKVAALLIEFYPNDDSIAALRGSMAEIGDILTFTAKDDSYWTATRGGEWND